MSKKDEHIAYLQKDIARWEKDKERLQIHLRAARKQTAAFKKAHDRIGANLSDKDDTQCVRMVEMCLQHIRMDKEEIKQLSKK